MRGTAILNRGKDQRPTVPAAGVQADTETPGHARPRTREPRLCGRKHGSLWTPACACPASPRACAVLSPPPPPRPGPRTQQGCLRRGSWLTVPCLCDFVPRSLLLTGPPSPLVRARPNGLVLTALHLEDLKSKRKSCGLEREHRNSGSHSSVYNNAPLPSQSTVSHRHAAKTPHTQHLTI